MKYREKPVSVEAIQLLWQNWGAICKFAEVGPGGKKPWGCWIDDDGQPAKHPTSILGLWIPIPEGVMLARMGDWIVKGVQGELYPVKNEIFEATYEVVEVTENQSQG